MTFKIKTKKVKKPSDYNSYLLPSLSEKDIDSYTQKVNDYEKETEKYKINPQERLEIAKQLNYFGIKGRLVGLNNGLRINKGKTNYDIFYDRGKDTYVIYKLTQKGYTDFSKEKFTDVYVEDLKEIIK